jgi:hypothetical protein
VKGTEVYKYTIDSEVFELFAFLPKRQRDKLVDIFRHLGANPHVSADLTQADRAGRICRVKRFGEWLVTYWPEHLVKEVHIIAVQHLRM